MSDHSRKIQTADSDLLHKYVTLFTRLDDLADANTHPDLIALTDDEGHDHWTPIQRDTPPAALDAFYAAINPPAEPIRRLPHLYEKLILSYCWAETDLGAYRLLPNQPGPGLTHLASAITRDKHLFVPLSRSSYIQFAHAAGANYDPVCFDLRRPLRKGDCRIVQIHHEPLLQHGIIKENQELAKTFRDLILHNLH